MSDQWDIFEPRALGENWRVRRPLPYSIAIHVVLFMVILRGRTPIFVAPTSVLGGVHGSNVTHLYWASGTSPLATNSTEAVAKRRIVWQKPQRSRENSKADDVGATEIAAAPSPTAGSPYGSLSDGASGGE